MSRQGVHHAGEPADQRPGRRLLLPWHRELDALEEARLKDKQVRLHQAGHRPVLLR
ncbi:MAG: hypothetical protein ACLU38_00310 [Dysosmobacter sp.]